jgi:hypothetical protein
LEYPDPNSWAMNSQNVLMRMRPFLADYNGGVT